MNLVQVLVVLCLNQLVVSLKEFSLARYSDIAVYANNSVIDSNLVGEGFEEDQFTNGGALECHTDDTTCCNFDGTEKGKWYFQNGTQVPFQNSSGSGSGQMYVTRGEMVIRLNRVNHVRNVNGIYQCKIPSAGGSTLVRNITLEGAPACNDLQHNSSHINITYTPPRDVLSMNLNSDKRYRGTIATYTCSSGYKLVGGSSLRACATTKVLWTRPWNGTEPYCVSVNDSEQIGSGMTETETEIMPFSSDDPLDNTTPRKTSDTNGPVTKPAKETTSVVGIAIGVTLSILLTILFILISVLVFFVVRRGREKNKVIIGEHPADLVRLSEVTNSHPLNGNANEVTSRPVPLAEFGTFVYKHHAQGNKQFSENYGMLSKGEAGHSALVSVTEENLYKNRFGDIRVYDDNQIILQPLATQEETYDNGYINASYVNGYYFPKKFIAAQGPLENTVIDFWRMVWQERPSAIVMLANCMEGGKAKCEQYWPESGDKKFGPFLVSISGKQRRVDCTTRKLEVKNQDGKSYGLTQFHFTSWPDHGVPNYASPILSFYRLIRSRHDPSTGPLLVHCSAGVGRTGTYITLDNVFDQVEAEGLVDIDGVIVKARNQRMKLVQTKAQYIFIHDAIHEFLTCGDTQISSANLRVALHKLSRKDTTHQCTGYQHQFNVLEQLSPNPAEINCSTALQHPDKNRGDKYLPVERSRIVLENEEPDYIHAVIAPGYKDQEAYIIAQNPLQSTVRNFWKMITDEKCGVVVMLSNLEENGKKSCAQYWPSVGSTQYGEFTVELVDKEEIPCLITRKLVVKGPKSRQEHQVTHFHMTEWFPDGTCSNLNLLTELIEEVVKVQQKSGNHPVIVHCSDTVSRSGMFCTIATTIDRCKTEGVVDVFQVIKALRIDKPGAVLTVEQYKLVHEAMLVYLESFDTYANFKAVYNL